MRGSGTFSATVRLFGYRNPIQESFTTKRHFVLADAIVTLLSATPALALTATTPTAIS